MTDEAWARKIERELGGTAARMDATDASVARLSQEMRDGFAKQESKLDQVRRDMHNDVEGASAHIRGELAGLSAAMAELRRDFIEDHKARERYESERNAKMIAELRASGKAATRINQYVFAGLILGAAGLQQLLEHLPFILQVFGLGP